MHITLETDYGIRMMICMAKEGKRLGAKTISEHTGVTLRFALKILRKFVASGIVLSYKGAQGGYELSRSPERITLRDIVETVEGPYYLSRCLDPVGGCGKDCIDCRRESCKVQEVFEEISETVRRRFEAVTLDQLI